MTFDKTPNSRTITSLSPIMFVDHSAEPGGGQLSLVRFLESVPSPERFVVVLLSPGRLIGRFQRTGASVYVRRSTFALQPTSVISASHFLAAIIKETKPSIVVANSLYAAGAMSFLHHPKACRWIYYSRLSMKSPKGIKRLITWGLVFQRFDGFISNSYWTRSQIPRVVSHHKPSLVAYPVSGTSTTYGLTSNRQRLREPEIRIVSLSRPDYWKGLDILVASCAILSRRNPSMRFLLKLYGGSFYTKSNYLRLLTDKVQDAQRKASNLTIEYEGHVEEITRVLDAADIMVLPSRSEEPFGQVIVQGMASGCVVVVPDRGGPNEIVQDRTSGFKFAAGSAESLADVLDEICANSSRSLKVARDGRIASARFSDEITVPTLLNQLNWFNSRQDFLARQDTLGGAS